jgi:hypothetical protein
VSLLGDLLRQTYRSSVRVAADHPRVDQSCHPRYRSQAFTVAFRADASGVKARVTWLAVTVGSHTVRHAVPRPRRFW